MLDQIKELFQKFQSADKDTKNGLLIILAVLIAVPAWLIYLAIPSCDRATAKWEKEATFAKKHPNPASFADAADARAKMEKICSKK